MNDTIASFFRMLYKAIPSAGRVLIMLLISTMVYGYDNPKTLPIGSKAPDFNLKGIDDNLYSLQSFSRAKILVIVFTCNHCPTAQAYEERIKDLARDYKDKNVELVA